MQRAVLIVDDSDQMTATLEVALSGLPGVVVVSARDGVEALQVLASRSDVQALITDLQMPRMDGFELIGRVRADGRLAGLPIIAVSGHADPHLPARARALGADAFFGKPFSPARLCEQLIRLLGAAAGRDGPGTRQ
jgi:CheY-like chemotaxis protein